MVEAGCFQEYSAICPSMCVGYLEILHIKPFLVPTTSRPYAETVEGLSELWSQIEVPNMRKAEECFFVKNRSSTWNIPGRLETYTTSPQELLKCVGVVRGSECNSLQCRLQFLLMLEEVSSI